MYKHMINTKYQNLEELFGMALSKLLYSYDRHT